MESTNFWLNPIVIKIGTGLLIFIGALIAINVFLKIVEKTLEKSSVDEVLHTFIINIFKVLGYAILAITLLNYVGVPTTSLIAVLGAAGAAVALALRDSLSNFAGGVLILINKPFSKGDFIEDLQTSGRVEKIDLLYSTLRTFDNKIVIIPNGKLANSSIINYTREEKRRVDLVFSISYSDDLEKAKSILKGVADSCNMILKEEDYIIGVTAYTGNSVDVDLKVWTLTDNFWDVRYFLQENIKKEFDNSGIKIPFPQMDVHLQNR